MANAKKATPKQGAGDGEPKYKLEWPVPGFARATLYFSDLPKGKKVAIFVTLMPGFIADVRRSALIGDTATADDIMEIDHFERIWPNLAENRQFLRVIFVSRSEAAVKFELGIDFNSDDIPEQRFEYEIEATGTVKDFIPVNLVG